MYCKECGNQIADGSKFCASCGKSQNEESIENLSLWGYYKKCFKNYANFEGRARRSEFWGFFLFDVIIGITLPFILTYIVYAISGQDTFKSVSVLSVLRGLYLLVTCLPSLAVHIRRLHDINKSGWWLLFAIFIPIIGQIMGLVWFCTDGEYNGNEYGPNPKCVNSGNGEPTRTKNKGSRISILAIIILMAFIIILSSYFIPKSFGMSAKAKAQEVVPAVHTWVKLQEAYYVELCKFGDCPETGYSMPGGGITENFTYKCGIEKGTAYFIAESNENLGKCPAGSKWISFMRKINNSTELEMQLPENKNCQELTPNFNKLESISGELISNACKNVTKAESSKKASGVRLAPEQPQKVLKIHKGTSRLEYQRIEK